jgi:predicted HicB family RNase H-like nuclease
MAILHYEIPDALHKALKIDAARQGVTLKDLIIAYLSEQVDTDLED